MNTFHKLASRLLSFVLLPGLLLGLSACDATDALRSNDQATATSEQRAPGVEQAVQAVATELDLSEAQQEHLRAQIARYAHDKRKPGALWHVAADLQETLTDEQKERLSARFNEARHRWAERRRRRCGATSEKHMDHMPAPECAF